MYFTGTCVSMDNKGGVLNRAKVTAVKGENQALVLMRARTSSTYVCTYLLEPVSTAA